MGASLIMTAIDSAGSGFNLAQEAFVTLNGGQIGQGVLDVATSGSSYLWTCLDDWCYVFGVLWARSNYGLFASSSLSGNEASSLSVDQLPKPKRD
jgi:hypothetical protein